MTTTALDTGLIERFAGQVFGYYVGGMTAYMIGIGHRTGLFEAAAAGPATSAGLPILDRVHPFENLFVATGHSMLGITLAPASGQALAGYVLSGTRPELLEPFRLQRFRRRSARTGPA